MTYEEIVVQRLTRLETLQKANHQAIVERLDRINGTVGDHQGRLEDHERRLTKVKTLVKTGIGVVAGGLLGMNPQLLAKILAMMTG